MKKITEDDLPKVIQAMMENGETREQKLKSLNGIINVIQHLKIQKKANSNSEYEISTEPIIQKKLVKILDEFDIFERLEFNS